MESISPQSKDRNLSETEQIRIKKHLSKTRSERKSAPSPPERKMKPKKTHFCS